MKNNMIHIDELVRSRLSQAEEKERPGAWLGMRELLDKAKPSGTAPRLFWNRRNFGALAALLLAGTLAMGGYHTYQAGQYNHSAAAASVASGSNSAAAIPLTSPISGATANDHSYENPAVNSSAAGNPTTNTTAANSQKSGHTTATGSSIRKTADRNISGNQFQETSATKSPLANGARTTTGTSSIHSVTSENNSPAANSKAELRTGPAPAPNTSAFAGGAVANTKHNPESHHRTNQRGGSATALAATTNRPSANSGELVSVSSNAVSGPIAPRHANSRKAGAAGAGAPDASGALPSKNSNTPGNIFASNTTAGKTPGKKQGENRMQAATKVQDAPVAAATGTTIRKDTIRKISVRERTTVSPRTGRAHLRQDTIDNSIAIIAHEVPAPATLARTQPLPLPAIAVAPHKKTVLPEPWITEPVSAVAFASSSAGAASTGVVQMQLLASKRVASKQNARWDAVALQDWFRRVQFNLSQIRMYPGMTAGLNSAPFGTPSLSGFHVGLAAAFVINEEWSILSEMRYSRKISGNADITDDYIKCSPYQSTAVMLSGVQSTKYQWTEDSLNHFFNIAGLQVTDLPVSLRYHLRRFIFAAGFNALYAFRVNVEEREYAVASGAPKTYTTPTQYASGFVPGYDSKQQSIFATDFGARFGLGYQLGAGYQISPAVYTDFRVSQQLWDNAATTGAKKVSAALYNKPVLQLSIGYRFGQRP